VNAELSTELQQQQGPGLSDYVNVIRRRIWQVLGPFIGLALAGIGVAFLIPREYKAMAEMEVIDPDAGVATVFTQVGYSVPHKHLLTTIPQDVRSVEFLTPLVEQFGITEGYNLANQRDKNRLYERMRKKVAVNAVLVKSGTDTVEFEYQGRDAERVTGFINALSQKWQEQFVSRYHSAVVAVEDHVKKVFEEAQNNFMSAQTKYRNFQEANGSDYWGKDPGGQARTRLERLKADLEGYELALRAEEATLRTVSEQLKTVRPTDKVDIARKRNPEWTKQNDRIEATSANVRKLEAAYFDTWQPLKDARVLLEEEKAKLEKIPEFLTDSFTQGPTNAWVKLTNDQTQATTTIETLRSKIEKTTQSINQLEAEVKVVPEKSAQAAVLRDAVDSAGVQLDKALKMRAIVGATRDRVLANSKRFFRTTIQFTPEEAKSFDPVWPNYPLFAGIGAFIGLLVGGAIAFIGEFTSSAFTTPNQVRYMLQVPVLGEVAPIFTIGEERRRKRRRWIVLTVLGVLAVVVLVIHLMWFDKDNWRAELPPAIRDFMKRIYGGR
jgi:hypothetical protein